MHYIFVVNGRKDKEAFRQEVFRQLEAYISKHHDDGNVYDVYETECVGSAAGRARIMCECHPDEEMCFVACGGDGTLNEVATGMLSTNATNKHLAIFSNGEGCDYIKYYPDYNFFDIEKLVAGTLTHVDVMKVNNEYCVNVCDFGFDSLVCSEANYLAAKGVSDTYRKGIAYAIVNGRFNKMDVFVDGEKMPGKHMLLCTLANGRYVGGEFLAAPHAVNDDGIIEVCYIRSMTLLGFLLLLPIYTRGEHLDNRWYSHKIFYRRAKHIRVVSKEKIDLTIDGEMLPGKEFDVTIIHKGLPLVLPAQ